MNDSNELISYLTFVYEMKSGTKSREGAAYETQNVLFNQNKFIVLIAELLNTLLALMMNVTLSYDCSFYHENGIFI